MRLVISSARDWLFLGLGATLIVAVLIAVLSSTAQFDMSAGMQFGEILKTVVASFGGATFAFLYARSRDRAARRDEHRAAGNVAMTILTIQYAAFINAIVGVEQEIAASMLRSSGDDVPMWLHLRRPYGTAAFNSEVKQRVDELTFLAEYDGGPEALANLIDADIKYRYFFDLLLDHAADAKALQFKFEAAGYSDVATDHESLFAILGPVLMGSMESLVRAILQVVENDKETHFRAAKQLEEILSREFPGKKVLKLRPLDLT